MSRRWSGTTDAVTHATEGRLAHDSEADDRHRRDPRRGSRAHGVRHEPAGGHRRRRRRQLLRHQQGHAGHRDGGAALRRPLGPRAGHEPLGGPGGRPGEPEVRGAGLRARLPGRGRPGDPAGRGPGGDEARVGPERRRRGRHAELVDVADGAADPGGPQHRPDLAGEHQPDADAGRERHDGAEAAVRELLPGGHDGPHPGPVRRPVPGAEGRQEEHRRDRRRQDLRRRPGRAVRQGGREARRERSSRGRRSARRTPTSPA